jgi:hypothetical protein
MAKTIIIRHVGKKGKPWAARGGVRYPPADVWGLKNERHKMGRPSAHMHILVEEATWRLAHDEVPEKMVSGEKYTVSYFARALRAWFTKTYPDLRAPKWTTIRNAISDVWHKHH